MRLLIAETLSVIVMDLTRLLSHGGMVESEVEGAPCLSVCGWPVAESERSPRERSKTEARPLDQAAGFPLDSIPHLDSHDTFLPTVFFLSPSPSPILQYRYQYQILKTLTMWPAWAGLMRHI